MTLRYEILSANDQVKEAFHRLEQNLDAALWNLHNCDIPFTEKFLKDRLDEFKVESGLVPF